jgi:hypothetical protein
MNNKIIIISLILICSMLLSSTPIIFGNYASAATGAANFLPNAFYNNPAQGGFDTVPETQRSQNAANYITSLLKSRYGNSNCFEKIGGSATKGDYQSTLNLLRTNYDNAVVFSKGHRTVHSNHPGLIPSHNQQGSFGPTWYLLDYEIYPFTSTKNTVTFIWHCQTAYNYTGNGVTPTLGGDYFGLPYCFTHNPSMGRYGTSGSQVYLGWEDKANFVIKWPNGTVEPHPYGRAGSPNYEWRIDASNDYGRVAEIYWYYMSIGYTTKNALDQVSWATHYVAFDNSNLKNWLVVWGNGNLQLP